MTSCIHLYFTEKEYAILKARAESECITMRALCKGAIMFRAIYGPWKMTEKELAFNEKMLAMAPAMKLEDL